ncbi:MAG: hypothetical protein O3C27_14940 [Actinomycetota bacterium]|nr:hypothetical protein [Actinomycetota bacterium]
MNPDPNVIAARLCTVGDLASAGINEDIVNFLSSLAHGSGRFCAVSIERGDLRCTIVDNDWTALARQVADLDPIAVDGMPLPRRAVRAVIDGWIDDWVASGTIVTELSEDGVPHLHAV